MRIEMLGALLLPVEVEPIVAKPLPWKLLGAGALFFLFVWPKISGKRRNGTSERGGVSAISGERGLRNPVPRSKTSTRTEVRSPTSTRTEVRSPTSTSTSTRAHTSGNVTVTGGAGRGNTIVNLSRNGKRRKGSKRK